MTETIEIIVEEGGSSNDHDDVKEALALNSLMISEQASMLSNLSYSNTTSSNNLGAKNQLANQNSHNKLLTSILAKATNQTQTCSPLQARSAVNALTNNEMAMAIADLRATIEAFADREKSPPQGSE